MASRPHSDVTGLCFNAPPATVTISWQTLVRPRDSSKDDPSPIDSFYTSHAGLTKLAGLLGSGQLDDETNLLLGGQILLGYVSATELYLRESAATSARICPIIRNLNKAATIPFGALDYYTKETIEHALTERVSFSEPGAIGKHLRTRLGVDFSNNGSLYRSIEDFERLCQLRHSLVHSSGVMNSSNATLLLGEECGSSRVTRIDQSGIQLVASVTINLVRDINLSLMRSIIWNWISQGTLTGDGRKDRPRIVRLLHRLGSEIDRDNGYTVSAESEVLATVKKVMVDVASNRVLK